MVIESGLVILWKKRPKQVLYLKLIFFINLINSERAILIKVSLA